MKDRSANTGIITITAACLAETPEGGQVLKIYALSLTRNILFEDFGGATQNHSERVEKAQDEAFRKCQERGARSIVSLCHAVTETTRDNLAGSNQVVTVTVTFVGKFASGLQRVFGETLSFPYQKLFQESGEINDGYVVSFNNALHNIWFRRQEKEAEPMLEIVSLAFSMTVMSGRGCGIANDFEVIRRTDTGGELELKIKHRTDGKGVQPTPTASTHRRP